MCRRITVEDPKVANIKLNEKCMKVAIFEVCRSPDVVKVTEPVILSRFFKAEGIDFQIHSNDAIWPSSTIISLDYLRKCLQEQDITIVHLAMHGNKYGFVLKWSSEQDIGRRTPEDNLLASDIVRMKGWQGKLVVSGACETAGMAAYFLQAGALAVVAPKYPISWTNLAQFFCEFYRGLFFGKQAEQALKIATAKFPEYACYDIYTA